MVNIMMGPEGSGKTKQLIGALNQAVQRESGSIVCIEKGDTLRFDVDHKVRLIDIKDYAYGGYPFLRGFISGLHAGNFDITHIFMDNLYKLAQSSDPKETENFLDWCSVFSAENSVAFTPDHRRRGGGGSGIYRKIYGLNQTFQALRDLRSAFLYSIGCNRIPPGTLSGFRYTLESETPMGRRRRPCRSRNMCSADICARISACST